MSGYANSSTIQYQFDWDGTEKSEWLTVLTAYHTWTTTGLKSVSAISRLTLHPELSSTSESRSATAFDNDSIIINMNTVLCTIN